jgi:hypothetical protein
VREIRELDYIDTANLASAAATRRRARSLSEK